MAVEADRHAWMTALRVLMHAFPPSPSLEIGKTDSLLLGKIRATERSKSEPRYGR
jgi:hypothetical protein